MPYKNDRNISKVNVFAEMSREKLCRPLFCVASTMTGSPTSSRYVTSQCRSCRTTFQSRFVNKVGPNCTAMMKWLINLDEHLSNRWIWCEGLIEWPPRPPGLTPMGSLLLSSLKDGVNPQPQLPTTLHELKTWIKKAWSKTDHQIPAMCDRKSSIGLMFVEPLVALALNICNN